MKRARDGADEKAKFASRIAMRAQGSIRAMLLKGNAVARPSANILSASR
jgi:hypothetical protein